MSTENEAVTIRIVTDNHVHRGQPIAKGDTIEVHPIDAAWLISQKIGEEVK